MARARIEKEIHAEVKNETALLGRVTSAMAVEDVYVIHLSAYSVEGQGYLQMLTKDNPKAMKAIGHFIPKSEERDVVVVEFENKVGTLAEVAKILGNHGIEVHYVYGTSGDGFKIIGVFSTSDNARAVSVINEESGVVGGG